MCSANPKTGCKENSAAKPRPEKAILDSVTDFSIFTWALAEGKSTMKRAPPLSSPTEKIFERLVDIMVSRFSC
jgi:hypothetical protein